MTDQPAWLLADGRVVLERHGVARAALAVEAALRSDRRNGRPPVRDVAIMAAVLAAAVPQPGCGPAGRYRNAGRRRVRKGTGRVGTRGPILAVKPGSGIPHRGHRPGRPLGLYDRPPAGHPDPGRDLGHPPGRCR